MSDLIRREDAYAAIRGLTRHIDRIAAITALPAVQPDAAAIREAALREALEAVNAKWRSGADTPDEMRGLALAEAAILALIDKPAHVNETAKSEHVPVDVLTPAKGDTHD